MKQPMSLDKDISYDTEAGPRMNTRLAGLTQVNTFFFHWSILI